MPENPARTSRIESSERLRSRRWAHQGRADLPGAWFQFAALGLYVCLLYKLPGPGVVLMFSCAAALFAMRRAHWYMSPVIAGLAICYVGLATVTAFMVSAAAGGQRTVQFVLTVLAALAAARYVNNADRETRDAFVRRFVFLNIAILVHVVAYHLLNGHVLTWKYLYDTKFVLSMSVLLLFASEDVLRQRSYACWLASLAGCSVLVLMSSERKAYACLAISYLLSRTSLMGKAVTIGMAIMVASVLLALNPGSPVVRQLQSAKDDAASLSNRALFMDDALADHSDKIRTFVNRNADRLFAANPWFGVGATGYLAWAERKYGSLVASRGLSTNVHGERHRLPAENGWTGIFVAVVLVGLCLWSALSFIALNGGTNASAAARTPLYALVLLLTYAWGEAMDNTMLFLILGASLTAASLPHVRPGIRKAAARDFFRRARPAQLDVAT